MQQLRNKSGNEKQMKRLQKVSSPLKLPANQVALFSVSRRTSLRRGGCTSHLSVERRQMIEKKK
jgi:hypothetical protein